MDILNPKLVLASTSRYRREILAKLQLPFEQVDPEYVELEIPGETPADAAARLATGKALAVIDQLGHRSDCQQIVVIGSDQVAHTGNVILHKPVTFDNAVAQLVRSSGNRVTFSTAVCVACHGAVPETRVDQFEIKFRHLSLVEITAYLRKDEPYDCAGSFKAESLGLALFEEMHGSDINTLYGLPLLTLLRMLRHIGVDPLLS